LFSPLIACSDGRPEPALHDHNLAFGNVKNRQPRRYSAPVRVLAPILLTALVVTAGCGSKSPREQFVSKLNAMCEDFAAREQQIGEPRTQADLAARGDQIVAAFEQTILRPLQQVEVPPEVAPQVAQLRVLTRQQHDALRGLAEAGRVGDVTKVRQLAARNTTLNAQAGQIAHDLKAESCAS
jgi:hypothetical protein